MKFYKVIFHVKPILDLGNDPKIGGAFVACWIEAVSLKKANDIAIEKIKENNWEIIKKDKACQAKEDYYRENDPQLKYYQQALIDKCVLVFYTYPKDEAPI